MSGRWPAAGPAVLDLCRKSLLGQHLRITHCLSQLGDAQVWWRPRPGLNAVGNLMLHLRGNVGQWIVHGVGGRPFTRDRPAEFDDPGTFAKSELESMLAATVAEAADVLSRFDPDRLLDARQVQEFATTAIGATLHATGHFEGHAQEIVLLTRQQLGDAYRPLWTPRTPAQRSSR